MEVVLPPGSSHPTREAEFVSRPTCRVGDQNCGAAKWVISGRRGVVNLDGLCVLCGGPWSEVVHFPRDFLGESASERYNRGHGQRPLTPAKRGPEDVSSEPCLFVLDTEMENAIPDSEWHFPTLGKEVPYTDLVVLTLILAVLITLGVWAVIRVKRWRQHNECLSPEQDLSSFRQLFEQGLLQPEEFERVRARLETPASPAAGPQLAQPAPPPVVASSSDSDPAVQARGSEGPQPESSGPQTS